MEKIEKLKLMARAYKIALEHDYCTEEDEEYTPDLEEYVGNRPYEIANMIIRTIEGL